MIIISTCNKITNLRVIVRFYASKFVTNDLKSNQKFLPRPIRLPDQNTGPQEWKQRILLTSILLSRAKHRKRRKERSIIIIIHVHARRRQRRERDKRLASTFATREHFVNISGSKSVARFPSVTQGCLPWERGERYTYIYIPGEKWKRERERGWAKARKRFQTSGAASASRAKWDVLAVERWLVVDVEGWRVWILREAKRKTWRGGGEGGGNEATRDSSRKRSLRQRRVRERERERDSGGRRGGTSTVGVVVYLDTDLKRTLGNLTFSWTFHGARPAYRMPVETASRRERVSIPRYFVFSPRPDLDREGQPSLPEYVNGRVPVNFTESPYASSPSGFSVSVNWKNDSPNFDRCRKLQTRLGEENLG